MELLNKDIPFLQKKRVCSAQKLPDSSCTHAVFMNLKVAGFCSLGLKICTQFDA